MSTTGRTYWWAKDSAWWRRERIVELGEEFGADGPAVIDWLCCEAKAQNDGGRVKTGVRSISRGSFVDPVTVGHVVSRSVTLGLLDDYEPASGRFVCRISGWKADQERALATSRKAAERERKAQETRDSEPVVTVSHGQSRSVTECPPTGQDRTEEQNPPNPPGGTDEAPHKPGGKRGRDLDAYWQQMNAWAEQHFPGCLPKSVAMVVGAIHAEGRTATPDVVREFASIHHNFASLLESEVAA